MTHWGWYWKIKQNHTPKRLCSNFHSIDSFKMFKNKEGVAACMNKVAYEVPANNLKAILYADHYFVEFTTTDGCPVYYKIPISKQPCNYGGFRYFFLCPRCEKRMRILYFKDGGFLCRKCMSLGYITQRLRPTMRYRHMSRKTEEYLKNRSGDLYKKPPRMHHDRYQKLKSKQFYYEGKSGQASNKELREWFGQRAEPYVDEFFDYVDESKEWRN
jgi:hypothetical protein